MTDHEPDQENLLFRSQGSPEKSSQIQCQICEHTAHGIHFGILACRACAAFFRRTVVLKKTYACRRANGMCKINSEERFFFSFF
ncbi:unnamed protein product [Caenorhabditis auriculariae]|uniref:Nuclear receptor domain-containing protein n=1 Tax=Caenorhabditis auriculariae TaxID=2777116 RepID=A0A8S1GUZ5_9PELO|nr:unnamed protein product [Caenorhabditis auriculariae]